MVKKLPDKPSELIELALKDLETVEKLSILYKVDMATWHDKLVLFKQKCKVCLAGAVIACSLGESVFKHIRPEDFKGTDPDTYYKLISLNYFRMGDIYSGLRTFYKDKDNPDLYSQFSDRDITHYTASVRDFRTDMENLVTYLKLKGQ